MFLKRTPFAHEHEVRLLYVDSDKRCEGRDFIDVPFDANAVIEEIMLDPRLRAGGGGEHERLEWLLANGFKNTTNVSNLYQRVMFQIPLYKVEKPQTVCQLTPKQNSIGLLC